MRHTYTIPANTIVMPSQKNLLTFLQALSIDRDNYQLSSETLENINSIIAKMQVSEPLTRSEVGILKELVERNLSTYIQHKILNL